MRRKTDLENNLHKTYDKIDEAEELLVSAKAKKRSLLADKITQKMMATLYDVGLPTINEHIKKIYADSELEESSTIRNFRIVQSEGSRQVTRDTKHYNLQMIIAVGFQVNNERAVQFRKWANGIVKDYTIKGWVMDDERLKNGGSVLTVEYCYNKL